MKYVALCILGCASMLSAAASFNAPQLAGLTPQIAVSAATDPFLMVLLAAAPGILQLRRRQKSLRTPRLST